MLKAVTFQKSYLFCLLHFRHTAFSLVVNLAFPVALGRKSNLRACVQVLISQQNVYYMHQSDELFMILFETSLSKLQITKPFCLSQ